MPSPSKNVAFNFSHNLEVPRDGLVYSWARIFSKVFSKRCIFGSISGTKSLVRRYQATKSTSRATPSYVRPKKLSHTKFHKKIIAFGSCDFNVNFFNFYQKMRLTFSTLPVILSFMKFLWL